MLRQIKKKIMLSYYTTIYDIKEKQSNAFAGITHSVAFQCTGYMFDNAITT